MSEDKKRSEIIRKSNIKFIDKVKYNLIVLNDRNLNKYEPVKIKVFLKNYFINFCAALSKVELSGLNNDIFFNSPTATSSLISSSLFIF